MKTIEEIYNFYGVEDGKTYRVTKLNPKLLKGFSYEINDKFKIDDCGVVFSKDEKSHSIHFLVAFDYEEYIEVLNEKEKEYLSCVIKPFRNRIISIDKGKDGDNKEYIYIKYKDDDRKNRMVFPSFPKGTMYKGMELNKEYTLEELGLWID